MTKQRVTAIFDIGKTNKKFFLFDKHYNQVYNAYHHLTEIQDEDGYPTEDLSALTNWVRETLEEALNSKTYKVEALNFSTYGASLVHLNEKGEPLTPLYNYLKPIPESILRQFFAENGGKESIERDTGAPLSGNMLNSGLQLYWLKYTRPDVFAQIKWTLHLPQYLSYLFTDKALCEYTSVGCHTALWHYGQEDYHPWVYKEQLDKLFPPLAKTNHYEERTVNGQKVKIGIGIHDSSSALLPYLLNESQPFLLLSTGTWNIALNAFEQAVYTEEDLDNDILLYLRRDGQPVRASRYFLGDRYKKQIALLNSFFNKPKEYHKQVKLDKKILDGLAVNEQTVFGLENLSSQPIQVDLGHFDNFEEAYHQFMFELVSWQVEAMKRAIKDTAIKKIYIDGGFAENDLFIRLIAWHFPEIKLRTTKSPLGSALGAAMVMADKELPPKFLKKHYKMKKLKSNSPLQS